MPEQIKRLLPLFAFVVLLFLIARHFLIPDTFGQFGHYRGDALKDNANKELVYATQDDCIKCHQDIQELIENDVHMELSCIACHGAGSEHVNNPVKGNIEKNGTRDYCGRCHSINPARSADIIFQVNILQHYPERKDCIDCHNPHQVWEIKE